MCIFISGSASAYTFKIESDVGRTRQLIYRYLLDFDLCKWSVEVESFAVVVYGLTATVRLLFQVFEVIDRFPN